MMKLYFRPLLAAILVGILAGTPIAPLRAQEPAQAQAPAPLPAPAQGNPPAQGGVPISLGVSKFDYSRPPKAFPNITNPYRHSLSTPASSPILLACSNSSRTASSRLSLQDAIALALENSMDIVVQRYSPWIADVSLLKARAGGFGYGTPGSIAVGSTANLPNLLYDPFLTQVIGFSDATTPIANPFTSGTGSTTAVTTAQPLFSTAPFTTPPISKASRLAVLSASPGITPAPLPPPPTFSIPTFNLL